VISPFRELGAGGKQDRLTPMICVGEPTVIRGRDRAHIYPIRYERAQSFERITSVALTMAVT
jgi:hypothetical protein